MSKYILEELKEDQGIWYSHLLSWNPTSLSLEIEINSGKRSSLNRKEAIKGENFLSFSFFFLLDLTVKVITKEDIILCLGRGYKTEKHSLLDVSFSLSLFHLLGIFFL